MSKQLRVPALTVIAHPDLARIGERVLLPQLVAGQEVELSRTTPDLAPPDKVWPRPLQDLYLSRRPVLLRRLADDRMVLERRQSPMVVKVAGEQLSEHCQLPVAVWGAGIDLELAERVVVLLHLADPAPFARPERYGLVGDSDAMAAVRAAIGRVADLEVPVLLRGESGTGKELVARALHDSSVRRSGPFVGVNLSAIPPSLAAAELFGATKGAFTGAVREQKGFFRTANGGTLFLDEVGECPVEVQTMLLRALETSEVLAVGSQQPRRVDVRLVAATDSDLEAKADSGAFREPLLHRLSAYEIWLAPLRERRDDIGRLMLHFAAEAQQQLGEALPCAAEGDQPSWIPACLAAHLTRYHWPGNVRQLRNLVWQLVIDSRGQPQLPAASPRLQRLLENAGSTGASEEPAVVAEPPAGRRRPSAIGEQELVAAMRQCDWEPAAAARLLGISRSSLYDLVRRCKQLRTAEDLATEEINHTLAECDGDVGRAAVRLEVSARGLRRRLGRMRHELGTSE